MLLEKAHRQLSHEDRNRSTVSSSSLPPPPDACQRCPAPATVRQQRQPPVRGVSREEARALRRLFAVPTRGSRVRYIAAAKGRRSAPRHAPQDATRRSSKQ